MKKTTILMIVIGFFAGYMVGASMDPIDRAIRKAQKINRATLSGVSSLREGGGFNLFGAFKKPMSTAEKIKTDSSFSNEYVARVNNTVDRKASAIATLEEVQDFIDLAKQEVFIDSSLQKYLVSLGKLQLENGMVFKAITNLSRSFEINPNDLSTAQLLAMSYLSLYQISPDGSEKSLLGENAISYLKLTLKHYPNDINALYGLALIYVDQGSYQNSLSLFLRILELNPEHIDALLGVARVYYEQGDIDKARRLYEETEALLLEMKNRRGFIRQELNVGALDQKLIVIRNNLEIIYQSLSRF